MKKIVSLILAVVLVVLVIPTDTQAAKKKNVPNPSEYSAVFNANYYATAYPDLKAAFGTNETALFNHFYNYGMKEGRQGSEEFNVQAYMARYADLKAAFGNDLKAYYLHYITCGKSEGRSGKVAAAATTSKQQTTTTSTSNSSANQVVDKRAALVAENGYGYKPGAVLPNVTIYDMNGNAHSTSEYLGKALYINLFTNWCGPCNSEASDLQAMANVHANDVAFIMVDVDDDALGDQYFIKEHKITMPVYLVNGMFGDMAVRTIPRHIVVDRYGQVIAYKEGMASEKWIDEQCRKAAAVY